MACSLRALYKGQVRGRPQLQLKGDAAMHRILLGAVSALALSSAAFAADPEKSVWGGGDPSVSAYSGKYVPWVIETLDAARLSGYEWGGKSEGTAFNAEKVTANPTNLAVGQSDILKRLNGTQIPGSSKNYAFTVLAENVGPECLYLVTKDPNYKTLGDVIGNAWDISIATGGEKSGSYGSLKVLQERFPDLADVEVNNAGGNDKVLEAVITGANDFGFFVMRPDPSNQVFKTIKEKGLALVPVVDFELEDEYQFLDLKISYGSLMSDAVYHTTACTSVALITGDPANVDASNTRSGKRLQATIERVGNVSDEELLKSATAKFSSWRDFADNLKAASGSKLGELMNASKAALEQAKQKVQGG